MKVTLLTVFVVLSFEFGFAQCAMLESATVNPLPTNGLYSPGTIVTVCYTVDSFTETGTNWFHGVVLNFGPGWDISTLSVVSLPVGCDVNGVWGLYESCTSTGTGDVFGNGFYYDNPQGTTSYQLDGDPGNNYGDWGDDCIDATWTFCFAIQVDEDCAGGADLSITATSTGDGTTGSWNDISCAGIPFNLVSDVTCAGCTVSLTTAVTDPLCFGDGGAATATPANGTPPYSYSWDPGGQTTATVSGLSGGAYDVTVTDSTGCSTSSTVIITEPELLVADAGIDTVVCIGLSYTIGGIPTASGGTPPYNYSWPEIGSIDPNPVIVVAVSEIYNLVIIDNNGCAITDSVMIIAEICTGIDEPESYSFNISPNPNNGIFFLESDIKIQDSASDLIVYDVMGKEVFRKKGVTGELLDMRYLAVGMYQLVVRSDHGIMMKKMMKID